MPQDGGPSGREVQPPRRRERVADALPVGGHVLDHGGADRPGDAREQLDPRRAEVAGELDEAIEVEARRHRDVERPTPLLDADVVAVAKEDDRRAGDLAHDRVGQLAGHGDAAASGGPKRPQVLLQLTGSAHDPQLRDLARERQGVEPVQRPSILETVSVRRAVAGGSGSACQVAAQPSANWHRTTCQVAIVPRRRPG